MARTEREPDKKRSGRLVGAAETSKERAQWRRLQRKNLNILGLLSSKKSLSKRSRRKHEWVSGCKSSPGRSAQSWFHSKSGQT